MSTTRLPHEIDGAVGDNFIALRDFANSIGQFIFFGDGAPTFPLTTVAIYIRRDGTAGSLLYAYDPGGAAWNAFA